MYLLFKLFLTVSIFEYKLLFRLMLQSPPGLLKQKCRVYSGMHCIKLFDDTFLCIVYILWDKNHTYTGGAGVVAHWLSLMAALQRTQFQSPVLTW